MGRSVRNWFLFSGLSLIPLMSVAQDELRPMVQQNDCDQQTAPAENEPVVPAVDLEKRQKAIAGLAAVGAIAILGVSVIAATMMWAKRLRRLARAQGRAGRRQYHRGGTTHGGRGFWSL